MKGNLLSRAPRVLLATVATGALAIGLTACGSSNESSSSTSTESNSSGSSSSSGGEATTGKISVKPETIGYLSESEEAESEHEALELAERATKALGWKLINVNGAGDPQKYTQGAQTLLTDKVDGFIGASIEASQIRPQLVQFNAQKIPNCETVGGQARNPLWDIQINENEYLLGELDGIAAGKSSTEPEVVILQNTQNDSGVERQKGFEAGLKKTNPKAKIVFEQVVEFANPAASARKITEDALTKYPNVSVFYAVFDFSELPAIQVIEQRKSEAKVYGTFTGATSTPQLRNASSPLVQVAGTNSIIADDVCLNEFLKYFEKGTKLSQSTAEAEGKKYIKYGPVTKENVNELVPSGSNTQYSLTEIEKPFIEMWESEYSGK